MPTEDDWSPEQVAAWKLGNWTPEQISILEQSADRHIGDCEYCIEQLSIDPETLPEDDPYFCPIGEAFYEKYAQAEVEYSYQPNYDPQALKVLRNLRRAC